MKIAVIGTGTVGQAFASKLSSHWEKKFKKHFPALKW